MHDGPYCEVPLAGRGGDVVVRVCRLCGESMEGRRSNARFCSDGCRALVGHIARILGGETVMGYASVRARIQASQNRDRGGTGVLAWLASDQAEVDARYARRALLRRQAAVALATERYGDYGHVLLCDPCAYCGASGGSIDHIIAATMGGDNDWSNYAAACTSCNSSKGDRKLILWLAGRAPLSGVRSVA